MTIARLCPSLAVRHLAMTDPGVAAVTGDQQTGLAEIPKIVI